MRGWGGDGDESCGDGDNVENSTGDGMGMGMTGAGTVGNVDKYLSPCSSLAVMHLPVKFSAYIFIQCGVIDILPKLKMAAAAILNLWGSHEDHPRSYTRGAYSL